MPENTDHFTKHIAVLAFPFATHAAPLLSLVFKLSKASPHARFSFFSTAQSNSAIFKEYQASDDHSVKPYNIEDGISADYVFSGNPLEPVEMFLKATPWNFERAMRLAEKDCGMRFGCVVTDAFFWFGADMARDLRIPWVALWTAGPRSIIMHLQTEVIRDKLGVNDVPPENSEEDRIPKADDRSTKKAKFRSDDPHDNPVGGMSFRDKILQSSRKKEDIFESSFEDFYLSGEDVSMNFEEGLPSIHFSSRVQDELSKPWLKTVVIKLLGRPIGYKNLCNRLENIWKFSQGFDVIDLENDYFLVRFWSGSDVEAVLTGGPWVILGHYLSVQAWSPNFDCTSDCINSIHAWIRLPGMPIHYYNKQVLRYIGQMVGKVVKIDYCTESVERGKFARIAVELDLRKALVSQFVLDGKVQRVEYECLPRICFSCGKFGHTKDNCPEIIITGQNSNQANDEGKTSNKPTRTEKTVPAENPSYGPWMIVNKRGKSKPDYGHSKYNKSSNSVRDNDWRGSRFQILENSNMEVGLNGDNNPNIEEEVTDKNLTGEGSLHARVYDSQSAANDTYSSKVSSKTNHQKDTIEKPTKEAHQLTSRYNITPGRTTLDSSKHSVVTIAYNHSRPNPTCHEHTSSSSKSTIRPHVGHHAITNPKSGKAAIPRVFQHPVDPDPSDTLMENLNDGNILRENDDVMVIEQNNVYDYNVRL